MDLSVVKVKHCGRCKQIKDKSLFSKHASSADGLQSWCKECRRNYRLENREIYLEKDRERYLSNPEPFKLASKKQREKLGKEKIKEYNQNYAAKNKEKIAERSKKWRERNKEKLKECQRIYYLKNKQKYYEANRKKWETQPHLILEACRKRTAVKNQAVPKWADFEKIKEIYLLAKKLNELTYEKYEVDHIVPLKSKLVCGLHVEHNLQIISQSENAAKGNRWWPGKP